MRKVLFVMTHLGSGWEKLQEKLDSHPSIECFVTGKGYHHPDDLKQLLKHPHKRDNSAAVWADILFYDKDFSCKLLCQHCKFLYWSSPYEQCDHINLARPRDYYDYRLSGMVEYFKRIPDALWNPSLEDDLVFRSICG